MRSLLHKPRTASFDQVAARQVARLTKSHPSTLEVAISALPGQHEDVLRMYVKAFRQKGYRFIELSRGSEGLFTATFQRVR